MQLTPSTEKRVRLLAELATKESNLRYSTVVDLLKTEAYGVDEMDMLLKDAERITKFVFAPYDILDIEKVLSGESDLAGVDADSKTEQPALFNDAGYL